MIFSDTVAAALSGVTVRAAILCFMDFVDDPQRVWAGFGSLKTNDGNVWSGLGELGGVSGLTAAVGPTAATMTLTLSGVQPDMLAIAANSSNQVKNRTAIASLQFFDAQWKPLDNPYAIRSGLMDVMTPNLTATLAQVSVTVEGRWVSRRRPKLGLYTDRDQEARYPGDRGLELVASLVNKAIRWPTF